MNEINILKEVILKNQNKLAIFDEFQTIDVQKISLGEFINSYFILINNRHKFILKVLLDNSKKLENEAGILQDLPEEIGPYVYVYDNSKKILPNTYEILSFEKGKDILRYFEMHLTLFPRKLAEVHKIKSRSVNLNGKESSKLNLWDYFTQNNLHYFNKCPLMKDDIYIKELFPLFQKYIIDSQVLFDPLKEFSLIHGNLDPKNILFNEYEVRLINWENAHFCDNARDLVTFFYDESWYGEKRVKLENVRLKLFLDNYLKAYWSDPTLIQRINVWMIYDMFCSLIYVKFKYLNFENENEFKVLYKKDLEKLSDELFEILKRRLN